MSVSRLQHIPGIGVNVVGDRANALADPAMLRLENLDTDLRPPAAALEATRQALDSDAANSYLPFEGHRGLRQAAATHVGRLSGRSYDPDRECVGVAGGLNGVLNTLLAVTEPGSEVVLSDPIYAGLVNRIRLAGAIPRHVRAVPTPAGWRTDPGELASLAERHSDLDPDSLGRDDRPARVSQGWSLPSGRGPRSARSGRRPACGSGRAEGRLHRAAEGGETPGTLFTAVSLSRARSS